MSNKNLKIKDLVTIGVFEVIYFVVTFAIGMIGLVPTLFLVFPTVLGIVTGTIILLFMAKVKKPWALFILGMLTPLIMYSMGHTYILVVLSFIPIIIAEFIRRLGNYNSFKYNMLSFAFFNTWICGSLMQMLLARQQYIKASMVMGKDYVDKLDKLVTAPNMALVYVGAFIGGIIGAYIGRELLKKHFIKAGIV